MAVGRHLLFSPVAFEIVAVLYFFLSAVAIGFLALERMDCVLYQLLTEEQCYCLRHWCSEGQKGDG